MTADIYVRDTKDMLMASRIFRMYMVLLLQKQMLLTYVRKVGKHRLVGMILFNLKGKAFHYSVVLGLADNTTKVTKV